MLCRWRRSGWTGWGGRGLGSTTLILFLAASISPGSVEGRLEGSGITACPCTRGSSGKAANSIKLSEAGGKCRRDLDGPETAPLLRRGRWIANGRAASFTLRGGGQDGISPRVDQAERTSQSDRVGRAGLGAMHSEDLLAGDIQEIQFLKKRTGFDLGASVFALYAVAVRRVIATVGQPLRAAKARRSELWAAAAAEATSLGVGDGDERPAAAAAAAEALEGMPFAYLPSVGAMLLILLAAAANVLLLLGKRWSVRFKAWSSFEEVLTWREADAVLVKPVRHTGTPAICFLTRSSTPAEDDEDTSTREHAAERGTGESSDEGRRRRSSKANGALCHEEDKGASSEGDVSSQDDTLAGEEAGNDVDEADSTTSEREPKSVEGADGASFIYQRRKFVLKDRMNEDRGETGTFGLVDLPVQWPLGRYLEARGLEAREVADRLMKFGENSVDVKPPTFLHHLGERLTSPFVVFGLFNQVLWMLELYWLKAMIAIFEVLAIEAGFVAEAQWRSKQLDVRNASGPQKRIRAWRGGNWVSIHVEDMLPGDIVSVRAGLRGGGCDEGRGEGGDTDSTRCHEDLEQSSVVDVPADLLLLRGTAVVDEATLTGESVPQMKTSLTAEPIDAEELLDMTGRHESHVLLSGTTLLDQSDGKSDRIQGLHEAGSDSGAQDENALPESTPDGGALCFVLRTGAYSFQGDLRRKIDFGSHDLQQESRDAAYLLLFLLSFAALSSSHVIREGLKSKQLSAFRLLVQCSRIISAVVPDDLSFELKQCLRNGVVSLQRHHALACTEPHRVPLAGKVDVCLFDKTGTITSDKLLAETLVVPTPSSEGASPSMVKLDQVGGQNQTSATTNRAGRAAEVVIGGCHSIMTMNGELHGDPLELSALRGVRWEWNVTSHTARPQAIDRDNESTSSFSTKNISVVSGNNTRGRSHPQPTEAPTPEGESGVCDGVQGAETLLQDGTSVQVWRRHAFSSHLQRMSAVAVVSGDGLTAKQGVSEVWVLSKGSPESMLDLFDKESVPRWFDEEYSRMARAGRRVIALAHRCLGPSRAKGARKDAIALSRSDAEQEGSFVFDGFLSFNCKTRADSAAVMRDLTGIAKCAVTIVTGDSVLTASHVAREVGVIAPVAPIAGAKGIKSSSRGKGSRHRTPLLLSSSAEEGELRWVPLSSAPYISSLENSSSHPDEEIDARSTAGSPASEAGSAAQNATADGLDFYWNDVPELALKHDLCATGPAFRTALQSGEQDLIARSVRHFRVLARMTPALKEELATLLMEAGNTVLMCGDGSNDVGALRRSHVGLALLSGFGNANTQTVHEPSPKSVLGRPLAGDEATARDAAAPAAGSKAEVETMKGLKYKSITELRKHEREQVQADITAEFERLRDQGMNSAQAMWKATKAVQKKQSEAVAASNAGARGSFAASARAMFVDSREGDAQTGADGIVRIGDAPLAASFTSKKPSISAVVDVIRQGRCTSAAVLHTYQMVALRSLFSSYTSSVLYIMGARWPQRPLIATSPLFQSLHIALASPKALPELSPIKPPRSVFHRSTFASLFGQAAVHVTCMAIAVRVAKSSPSQELLSPRGSGLLRPKFVPSVVSNVVFLLSQIQAVSVAVVNFKGRPFMRGVLESRAIFLPAVSIVALCFALALEVVPTANTLLELAPFPSASSKGAVLLAMLVSLMGPFVVDRLCVMLFDPELHRARKASLLLEDEAKVNLVLLGLVLFGLATVASRLDFQELQDTLGLPSSN